MKTTFITSILILFLSSGIFGQDRDGYSIKDPVEISSLGEAASISRQILNAAGLEANFMIAEANVPNAFAVLQQGKRYILYNPGFIKRLTQVTGTNWAAVSVLAHEIGHHLYHKLSGRENKGLATELEADRFSGYVLEKMGATLEEAQAAMSYLATPYATRTHPAKEDRINSIAAGWQKAGGLIKNDENVYAEPTRTEPALSHRTNANTVLPKALILAKLQFKNAPGKEYFLTKRLNVVQVENNEIAILGRISKSDNKTFPFIISGTGFRLYVSSRGFIVNSNGDIIGSLTEA